VEITVKTAFKSLYVQFVKKVFIFSITHVFTLVQQITIYQAKLNHVCHVNIHVKFAYLKQYVQVALLDLSSLIMNANKVVKAIIIRL
jgi:hypothetical protein